MDRELSGRPSYVLPTLELFAGYGDRTAIVADGRQLSYAELRTEALDLAIALREQGIRSGMSVAVLIMLPIEGPALQLALHLIGCRIVWLVPGTGHREMTDYLTLTGPDAFLYDPRTSEELAQQLLGHLGATQVLCLGPDGAGPDLLTLRPHGTDMDPQSLAAGTPECVFQTSGTTGTPKAILHRDEMFQQVLAIAEDWLTAGHPPLRHLLFTPLWWSSGSVATLITLCAGGLVVIRPKWSSTAFLDAVREHQINYVFIAPAMFYELLDDPALATTDTSSLYMLNLGAAPTTPERLRQGIKRLGPVLRICYGLSESPYISALPGLTEDPAHPERLRSCGKLYGDVRAQIRDEHGMVLGPGEVGELWVRSKLNFAGYLGQPELTAETLVDGWMRTRDLGYLDADGYLYIVGRAQDMIITGVGARKIFAGPIEDVLSRHPSVRAAAVIGVPDDALVEVVHAYVVPAVDADVDLDELRRAVTDELAEICAPRSVDIVDSLPLVGFGKVDKNALRERYAAEHPNLPVGTPG
jgi:fatty-acyl-CoA synthase